MTLSTRVVRFVAVLALGAVLATAQERTGTVRVQVTPDHADWTYRLGEPVAFRVAVTRDGYPVAGASVAYTLGLERLKPAVEKTEAVPGAGLVVKHAGLREPGFLRLIATATVDGQEYRGLATAGVAPDQIRPTVSEPADFDAFWDAGRKLLADVPVDAKLTPLPEGSTAKDRKRT